ncbi:type I secretion system permease/ATPase [Xanthobacter autotrophicus]|uniref:type I secretion system permease/ATPase n=1 Tax=Xanthobacter TaxID=279 RepID=UPI0024ABEF3C|nr:type I secretion system permease/ATPase [Xanthobacter autotrophicus]MDI4663094.1 type I secretion system permease/ATPase [Xanthobacter autotrophicus]
MSLLPGSRGSSTAHKPTALDHALRAIRPAFISVIVFSFFINLLGLNASIYMMQVYDRVLSSRSIETLLLLTLITAFLYVVWSVLEALRTRVLERAGFAFDAKVHVPVFDAIQRTAVRDRSSGQTQSLRDLDTVRDFFAGPGLAAMCDLPWMPIYAICAALLHPYYGLLALGSAIFSGILAVLNNRATQPSLAASNRASINASTLAAATLRNAEVLQAMGMAPELRRRWGALREQALGWQGQAGDRGTILVALTKFNRALVQSVVIGLGAWLAINKEISPGMIIAGSILVGRCIQPIELAVSNWKSVVNMRSAHARIQQLLAAAPDPGRRLRLPDPRGELAVENLFVRAPGRDVPVVRGVSFRLPAGTGLGIVGPTAAGKSSLARAIVGVWPAVSGCVRLDGSELGHWDETQLGRSIGYLPQDVELFSGTIAENIARFGEVRDGEVVAAARLAGVHDLIQHLPQGYNTQIGEGGVALSGGQRQRIGLARAVFGLPALIVLDEPNASLDPPGELALAEALKQLKAAGRTVVIVTHRPSALNQCDMVLALSDGLPQAFGPREEIVKRMMGVAPAQSPGRPRPPLTTVQGGAGAPPDGGPAAGAAPSPAQGHPPAMEDGHAAP